MFPTGEVKFENIGPGDVVVTEDFNESAFEWKNLSSSNTSFTGQSGISETTTFGNILCDAGLAKTIGYWANNAERKVFGEDDITLLDSALVTGGITDIADLYNVEPYLNEAGDGFDSFRDFRKWLLSAKAKDMEYMLSAQLAGAALNVGTEMASANTLITISNAEAAELGIEFTVVDGQNVV